MILDHIDNAEQYLAMNPQFAQGFAFLRQEGLDRMEPGRHEIEGDNIYAIIAEAEPVLREEGLLEVHRQYVDVHYTVSGIECIGWQATSKCASPQGEYDEANDAILFEDKPEVWTDVPPEHFAICLPTDAHAPVRNGAVRKVILKVRVC